eukprot:7429442-Pyramimonas_sp.AAC.1
MAQGQDRTNTNEYIYSQAQNALNSRRPHKPLERFSATYERLKLDLLCRLISAPATDPVASCTFDPHTLNPWDYGPKRVGRPRKAGEWYELTADTLWRTSVVPPRPWLEDTALDLTLAHHRLLLRVTAWQRMKTLHPKLYREQFPPPPTPPAGTHGVGLRLGDRWIYAG